MLRLRYINGITTTDKVTIYYVHEAYINFSVLPIVSYEIELSVNPRTSVSYWRVADGE